MFFIPPTFFLSHNTHTHTCMCVCVYDVLMSKFHSFSVKCTLYCRNVEHDFQIRVSQLRATSNYLVQNIPIHFVLSYI